MTEKDTTTRRRAAVARLREAARLVDLALIDIDYGEAPCDCCGGPVARRPGEWPVYKNLSNVPDRLRDQAAKLTTADDRVNPRFNEALAAFHAAAQAEKNGNR